MPERRVLLAADFDRDVAAVVPYDNSSGWLENEENRARGWIPKHDGQIRRQEGTLVLDGSRKSLVAFLDGFKSSDSIGDFTMTFDFTVEPTAWGSGNFFFRVSNGKYHAVCLEKYNADGTVTDTRTRWAIFRNNVKLVSAQFEEVETGKRHGLRLEVRGKTASFWIDGRLVLHEELPELADRGRVGFQAARAIWRIDNLMLTAP